MTSPGCTTARELMLTADLAELRPGADSPLSRHIRDCASCARAARAIRGAHEELAGALDTLSGTVAGELQPRSRPRRRWWPIPAAAAAMITLLLLGRGVLRRDTGLEPFHVPARAVPGVPTVNAGAGGAVAIMRTSNPNITVVWQLERVQ